jgi:hypothetical protein
MNYSVLNRFLITLCLLFVCTRMLQAQDEGPWRHGIRGNAPAPGDTETAFTESTGASGTGANIDVL